MTERVLDEAMRYGSRRRYGDRQLGKFGLGLKTASLSQCRRLTVATRTTPSGRIRDPPLGSRPRLASATPGSSSASLPPSVRPISLSPLREGAGTVVLWEKLDRILAYSDPTASVRRRRSRR